jgi:hypothetical protein
MSAFALLNALKMPLDGMREHRFYPPKIRVIYMHTLLLVSGSTSHNLLIAKG